MGKPWEEMCLERDSSQIGRDWSSEHVLQSSLSSPVFMALYLNFNSKVTKTKTKITKGKRGKN